MGLLATASTIDAPGGSMIEPDTILVVPRPYPPAGTVWRKTSTELPLPLW